MIRIFIISLCLFICNITFSQSSDLSVYPIRVDHKWGYAKFYGSFVDTLIPPRYDYIGDVYLPWNVAGNQSDLSPYRLFEIDEKVGLLDNFLQEALPNSYNRILPISTTYFATESEKGFQLINEKEEVQFDGATYEDIRGERFDDQLSFFFVRKNRKWGVMNKAGDLILDHQFTAIQSAGVSGYFKVQDKFTDTYWRLIDSTGALLLPEAYSDVKVINDRVVIVNKDGFPKWDYYLLRKGQNTFRKQEGSYRSIEKITPDLLALVPYKSVLAQSIILQSLEGEFEVIKSMKVKVVGGNTQQIVPNLYPLDERYATQSFLLDGEKSIRYKLVDSKGAFHSSSFDEIRLTSKKEIYFVGKTSLVGTIEVINWGIFQPVENRVVKVKTGFSEILDFEDDIAITKIGDKYGAIAVVNNKIEELPCIFEAVYKSGKRTLQVQTEGEKAVIYHLTDEGKFVEDVIVSNTIVFSENEKRKIKEGEPQKLKGVTNVVEREEPTLGALGYNYVGGKLVIKGLDGFNKETTLSKEAIGIKELTSDLIVIYQSDPIKNSATELFSELPFAKIALFSISKNRILNDFPIIGLRPFVKGQKHTAFLDASGKMGLINRDGKQLVVNGKPLRYLYIGDFNADRARVCVGDQFFVDQENQLKLPEKYNLGSSSEFLSELGIREVDKIFFSEKENARVYALANEGNAKWGYIDDNGQIKIETKYDHAGDFMKDNKKAFVQTTLSDSGKFRQKAAYTLIGRNGNEILNIDADLLHIDYKSVKEDHYFFQIMVGKTPTFYFNQKGHQVFVNPTRMRPFSEGLALFRSAENKWGFVNQSGKIWIEPIYKYARPFSDGLALVIDTSGVCSFIDQKGATVFITEFTEKQQIGIGDFHEGRCWFKGKGWFWGCFDKTGKVAIEPKFYYKILGGTLPDPAEPYILPMDFKNGVASMQVLDEQGRPVDAIIDIDGNQKTDFGKYANIESFDEQGIAVYSLLAEKGKGILNTEGKHLCPPRYKNIKPFVNGFAKVQSTNDKWGLIDTVGKELVKTNYQEIGIAAEGMIPLKNNKNTWSFVSIDGKKRIPGPFLSVTPFQNGLSFVTQDKKQSLLDKSGNFINISSGKPLFFSEGVLGVLKNERAAKYNRQYYFSDDSGNNILGRNFKEIFPFQLGVAKVRILAEEVEGAVTKRELLGAINKRGVMIVPPKFRNLHLQPDGNIVINPQRFYGLVSLSGKVMLEPIYDLIVYYPDDQIFKVEQGEKIGYFTLENDEVEWVWEMRY